MLRIALAGAVMCLAVCPAIALAKNQEQTGPSAAISVPVNAMQLSRLLNPRDKVIEVAVRAVEFGFDAELKRNQEEAALFDEHPGLDGAILDAIRPIIRDYVAAELPNLQRRCAEFYAERFSSAEVDGLIEFYGSPTGTKLIQGMYAGADFAKLMEGIDEFGQAQFTPADVTGFTRSTVTRIFPIFDDTDKAYLNRFSETPLFAKLKAALPDFQRLMASIANEPTPKMDAEIEKTVDRVVEGFLAREEAQGSTT